MSKNRQRIADRIFALHRTGAVHSLESLFQLTHAISRLTPIQRIAYHPGTERDDQVLLSILSNSRIYIAQSAPISELREGKMPDFYVNMEVSGVDRAHNTFRTLKRMEGVHGLPDLHFAVSDAAHIKHTGFVAGFVSHTEFNVTYPDLLNFVMEAHKTAETILKTKDLSPYMDAIMKDYESYTDEKEEKWKLDHAVMLLKWALVREVLRFRGIYTGEDFNAYGSEKTFKVWKDGEDASTETPTSAEVVTPVEDDDEDDDD